MGWIKKSRGSGLQAVHAVGGEEVARRYFGYRHYNSDVAYVEILARRWLRWCMHLRPTANVNDKTQSNKRQHYPRGVCHAWNKRQHTHSIRVSWQDESKGVKHRKHRTRSFGIGTDEAATDADFRVAERAAFAFRAEYLACRRAGVEFDPSRWDDWRERYT